jgi:hypothetical protein
VYGFDTLLKLAVGSGQQAVDAYKSFVIINYKMRSTGRKLS